jgi:hypothetical protein
MRLPPLRTLIVWMSAKRAHLPDPNGFRAQVKPALADRGVAAACPEELVEPKHGRDHSQGEPHRAGYQPH